MEYQQQLVVTRLLYYDKSGEIEGAVAFVLYDDLQPLTPLVSKYRRLHQDLAVARKALAKKARSTRYSLGDFVGAAYGLVHHLFARIFPRLGGNYSDCFASGCPVLFKMGVEPVWFAIMFAMCLQTSFLTPPLGFPLFYIKGVCPPGITTRDIYLGVLPYIALQLLALALVFFFQPLAMWLPNEVYGG